MVQVMVDLLRVPGSGWASGACFFARRRSTARWSASTPQLAHAFRTAEALYAWHTSRCNRLSREIQELQRQGADRSGLQTDKAKALAALLDDKRARFTAEHKSLLRAKREFDEVKNRQLLLRYTSLAVFSRSQSAEHGTYHKAPVASSVSSGRSLAPGSRRHTSSSPTRPPRRAGTGTNQGRTMRARSQE